MHTGRNVTYFSSDLEKKTTTHKKRKLEANICWDISQNLDDMDQAYIDVTIKDIA